ncbi:MAG TPA: hypothetical protein VGV59_06510 [Pyrinomonadaceae bacterium]|nr:hypothetical protein [Pyrinomonadaceae bacterium]
MSSPFRKLIDPKLPSAAVGLSGEGAGVVSLDRRRGQFVVKRAGYVPLPEGLLRPGFDEGNVSDTAELADTLGELVTSVGLSNRHRWSVALPEAATHTSILTLESAPASRQEREEMLRWKAERAVGVPLDELRVGRDELRADAQGRPRYLLTAVRLSVLAEYEEVFATLGWHAGLILPRHVGEAWWLLKDDRNARSALATDSLLVSSHREGFTAVVLRDGEPLLVRNVACEAEDRADELYRFLLFYRDRNLPATAAAETTAPLAQDLSAGMGDTIERLLVAGEGLDPREASAIISETLSAVPHMLDAADVRLSLPASELDFNQMAAPAGLAALAWA